MTVDGSARRAARFGWVLVSAVFLVLAVRWCQGCAPDHLFSLHRIFAMRDLLVLYCALPGALMFLTALLYRPFLGWIGRPRCRLESARELRLTSPEAEDRCDAAVGELMRQGFRIGPVEPLPRGNWRRIARLRWNSLRRSQKVEFEYTDDRLRITHRYATGRNARDCGEREYQDWVLEGMRGDPPRPLWDGSVMILIWAAYSAVLAVTLHFAPESLRELWIPGFSVVLGALIPVGTCSLIVRRQIILPALILAVGAVLLVLSRQSRWETEPWRTTRDPEVLCRAGESAWLDRPWYGRVIPASESRELRAMDARFEIERRIRVIGASAVPAVLRGSDSEWRSRMIGHLGKGAIEPMLESLESPDAETRLRALEALESIPPDCRIEDAAARSLADPDVRLRRAAARYFAWTDGSSTPGLALGLHDPDSDIRRWCMYASGKRRCVEAVPRLAELMERGEFGAGEALSKIGTSEAISALLRHPGLLSTECLPSRIKLDAALADRLLQMADGPDRSIALAVLVRSTDPRGLQRAAREVRKSFDLLPWIYQAGLASDEDILFWIEKGRIPTCLDERSAAVAPEIERRALDGDDEALRGLRRVAPAAAGHAADVLLRRGPYIPAIIPEASIEELLRLLDMPFFREYAETALELKGGAEAEIRARWVVDPRSPAELRREIRRPYLVGHQTSEQITAIRSLSRMSDLGAVQLIEVIEEDDMAFSALEALGRTRTPRAYSKLVELLDHRRSWIRAGAAVGLGLHGDPKAIPHLLGRVEEARDYEIFRVAWALQKLTGERFGVLGLKDYDLSDEVVRARIRAWAAHR